MSYLSDSPYHAYSSGGLFFDSQSTIPRQCRLTVEVVYPGRDGGRAHRERLMVCGDYMVAKVIRQNISSNGYGWGYHDAIVMQIEALITTNNPFEYVTVRQLAKFICPWLPIFTPKLRYRRFYGHQLHPADQPDYATVVRDRKFKEWMNDDDGWDYD